MRALLAIKPQFVEKIFSGEKKYEFRKILFKNAQVNSVVIYASSPVQKIVGEFDIDSILNMNPEDLWEKTSHSSGIEKEFFDDYFRGRVNAFAIKLINPIRYDIPKDLKNYGLSHAPQSFCYLRD